MLPDIIIDKYPGHKGSLRESPELLQEVFDTFHLLIGLHLSHRWNQPCQYGFTTFYSNTPNHCPVVSWDSLTHVVCLAGHIAEVSGYGGVLSDIGDIHTHPSAVYLNLNQETIETIRKKLPGAVDTLLDVLAAP